MRNTRTITIVLDSALDDDKWAGFVDNTVTAVESLACDYAASMIDDDYVVLCFDGQVTS